MRPDYCPVANEPCQALCLDGCRLRERSYYVAELEKERKQLQAMLHQERTETEALLRQALEALQLSAEGGPTKIRMDAAIAALRARLSDGANPSPTATPPAE